MHRLWNIRIRFIGKFLPGTGNGYVAMFTKGFPGAFPVHLYTPDYSNLKKEFLNGRHNKNLYRPQFTRNKIDFHSNLLLMSSVSIS